jgi:elongation factor P
MATLSNTDLRNGTVFKDGGDVYSVVRYEHSFRGRGGGIVKVRVRNLHTGNIQEKTYRQNEKVESVDTKKSSAQFLYSDGKDAHFMDTDSYEQFTLPLNDLGEGKKYLKEGDKIIVLYLEEKPVSVEIPRVVELKVSNTVPGVKGDTANNPTKKATMENGLVVDVPLFVKEGDAIKVNTDSGTYISRV